MAFVVDLDMDMPVQGRFGPALDTISCEDPCYMMCLVFHVVDSLLDEIV